MKTIIIISTNGVKNIPDGSHCNGKVLIIVPDKEKFTKENDNRAYSDLLQETWSLEGKDCSGQTKSLVYLLKFAKENDFGIEKIYVYWEKLEKDIDRNVSEAMLSVAYSLLKKDKSKIELFGCDCCLNLKETVARQENIKFTRCECGGESALRRIFDEAMEKGLT